jgi:uncharacterized membrane protein YjfL (UPF0719 family)
MTELFDKLIIRVIFTSFICVLLFAYKYAHLFLYPTLKPQIFKRVYPSKNSADSLHLFARILGIAFIFSDFYFYMSDGILFAILHFLIKALAAFVTYLLSIYILESIVLYNFEYHDEILKRKNFSYSIIGFAHTLGLAYIIKNVILISKDNIILLLFLWLFTIVLIGFATKTYQFFSQLPFNRLVIQKNLSIAFSYTGFFWGWCLIISSAINNEINNLNDIKWYIIKVILKLLLAIIIFPLFKKGITLIFNLQDDYLNENITKQKKITGPETGYGIFEGSTFLTSYFFTAIIIDNINFGTFYPVL